jgi:hypothetical protein
MKNLSLTRWLSMAIFALTLSIFTMGCAGDSGSNENEAEVPVETPTPSDDAKAEDKAIPAEKTIEEPAPAPAPKPVAEATVAALEGTVTLKGTPPVMTEIANINDPKCHTMHGDKPLKSDRVLCGENGGLQNVFITITNPPAGDYPTPEKPVILDQVGCMYSPHVVGIQVNQDLEVRNSDPTMHNVHRIARKNGQDNKMQMPKGKPIMAKFTEVEDRMRYKCDIHPWMMSYVFVKDHPFFAVTDENGQFQIAGLPSGEYEVKAWHEHYKEQTGKVTIDANGAGSIAFSYVEEGDE